MSNSKLLVAALVAACGAPCAVAGDGGGEAEPIESGRTEEVEVRAAAPDAEEIAAFATSLAVDEERGKARDVSDLLRRVPGARVSSWGGLGRYATVSLRGSTAEQVTVLLDGVVQSQPLGGAVDLSTIPASQIESITVFRGIPPASTGTAGMGGLIDIRTRPSGQGAGQADALVGSYGALGGSASVGLNIGVLPWRLGVDWLRSRGDFAYDSDNGTELDPSDDERRLRINNDSEARSFHLAGRVPDIGGGDLDVRVRYFDRESGLPGTDALQTPEARLDENLFEASGAWVARRSGDPGSIEILADVRRREDFLLDDGELPIAFGARRQTTRITEAGMAVVMRRRAGAHAWLLRADLRAERARVRDDMLESPDRGGARRRVAAVTVEDRIRVGRVLLIPSVRGLWRDDEFVEADGVALAVDEPRRREIHTSGKIGVALPLGDGVEARGSVGRFYRLPNLLEMFGDRGMVRGNPALEPERGLKAEFGLAGSWKWSSRPVRWEAVVHGTDAENLIQFLPQALGVVVARNVQSAQIYGLELRLELALGPEWAVGTMAAWQDSEDTSGGFADGKPLPGRPEREAWLGLSWRPHRWRIDYEITYVGANSTDLLDTPWLRLPTRVLHDVRVARELGDGLLVGVELRNLFDRETRDLARFPLPGRTIYAHLGWSWGQGR